ncbi:helix-turn-helix domain-containing protein [Neobacillus dielmonensis]|uniref:helix-turn-helix domain-containing protein n=1 Tax=Neobacillus dielmonensis TaxID=1347369 RepID=UPI0005A68E7F|nr:helix-turn-helix domain-containing protein [Neobacillus dielmonensis]
MSNDFKIQIPQSIVRSNEITEKEFVLLAKFIQIYKSQPGDKKSLTFTIVSYKKLMNYINITDQRTFTACLKGLVKKKYIANEIKRLSRNGKLTISLSPKVIPELTDEKLFTQLEYWVINMSVIEKVGHTGVRILYYLMSWINYTQEGKDHCYASVERMAKDIGVSEKTFIKYIGILEDLKFIKVVRHETTIEYKNDKYGNENLLLDRWNNHYYIKLENIKKFVDKNVSLVG